jgi:hypothetical protein
MCLFVRWHYIHFYLYCFGLSALPPTVAICGGWDFEALSYQTVVILSKCTKAQIGYIAQLTYIACCSTFLFLL